MSLIEYLYVDEDRVNTYFEQISSPVVYDKVPVWKAGLSLTGPNAEGQQARFARSFTRFEKIQKLTEYIQGQKEARNVFTITTCLANRVFIPSKASDSSNYKGITLWLSPSKIDDDRVDTLCLLEDYRGDDEHEHPSAYSSAWSALTVLLEDIDDKLNESILAGKFSHLHTKSLEDSEFHKNPLGFLSTLGAYLGPQRIISLMYRHRITLGKMADRYGWRESERHNELYYTVTIGYPIWIADANDN